MPDYPEKVKEAIKEIHRQVGDLKIDEEGIAFRGLLIRHLVLPENLAGTRELMAFVARGISPESFVNVMRQYHPAHRAREFPPLGRSVTRHEYERALREAEEEGISSRE